MTYCETRSAVCCVGNRTAGFKVHCFACDEVVLKRHVGFDYRIDYEFAVELLFCERTVRSKIGTLNITPEKCFHPCAFSHL